MSDHTLSLGPELTIVHAAELRDRLLQALGTSVGDLHVNLQDAQEIDSSGVQLMLALQKSLQAQGRRLQVTQVSRPVKDALGLYGLTLD